MTRTFYDLLGVAPDASTEEIERAYREAIKEVHPDVSDDVDASERAARLNKARDVLTDARERARYDRLGHESFVSASPGDGDRSTGTPRSAPNRRESDPGGERESGRDASDPPGAGRGRYAEANGSGSASAAGPGTDRRASGDPWGAGAGSGSGPGTGPGPESPSARRQAAASTTPGPNIDDSWNAWDRTRDWAVHRDTGDRTGWRPDRFVPPEESLFLLAMTFFLYPVFVFSAALPAFHPLARVLVAACTMLVIVYLLSMPEVAILVFGLWSLLLPLGLLVYPASGLLSLVGVVALLSTWVPFGLSVLTYTVLEPV